MFKKILFEKILKLGVKISRHEQILNFRQIFFFEETIQMRNKSFVRHKKN